MTNTDSKEIRGITRPLIWTILSSTIITVGFLINLGIKFQKLYDDLSKVNTVQDISIDEIRNEVKGAAARMDVIQVQINLLQTNQTRVMEKLNMNK